MAEPRSWSIEYVVREDEESVFIPADLLPDAQPGDLVELSVGATTRHPPGPRRRARRRRDAWRVRPAFISIDRTASIRTMPDTFPALRTAVLDATDSRALGEFYRELLGFVYRSGDELPPPGQPDPQGEDWLVLRDRTGEARLAIQQVDELRDFHVAGPGGPAATPPRPHRAEHGRADVATRSSTVARRQGAARSVGRSGRAALRVRRPGRPPLLHLRLAGPPGLIPAERSMVRVKRPAPQRSARARLRSQHGSRSRSHRPPPHAADPWAPAAGRAEHRIRAVSHRQLRPDGEQRDVRGGR